jgi:hypothetical protein
MDAVYEFSERGLSAAPQGQTTFAPKKKGGAPKQQECDNLQ